MTITREMFDAALDLSDSRIVVDPDTRRIAVRVAEFGEVHSGHSGEVRVPRNVNVDAAHIGRVRLDDGEFLPVAQLPMGTLHATGGISAEEAAHVYENTGRSVARVRYSVDEVGIRADGVLYDDVSDVEVERLVASAPSGDWRALSHIRRFSDFLNTPSDFVGAAVVNIPGYSGSFRKEGAEALRLVASGDGLALIDDVPDEADADCGGASWYAGITSTDGGNNAGWVFTDPPAPPASNTGNFLSLL